MRSWRPSSRKRKSPGVSAPRPPTRLKRCLIWRGSDEAVMGSLASELGPHAERIAGQPRLYVDANIPAGLVEFMRVRLQWDVLFVIEHDELRRARDGDHF